jgi:hypothetical protein
MYTVTAPKKAKVGCIQPKGKEVLALRKNVNTIITMTNIYKIPVIRPHHHLWFRNAIQRYELAFVHGLDKKYNIVKKET